jgi:hypothetical protein
LHQAAFLLVKGGALGAEEPEFVVASVEDVRDGALLFDVRRYSNFYGGKIVEFQI